MMKPYKSALMSGMVAIAFAAPAAADSITFAGSSTGPGSVAISASVKFTFAGNDLTVLLKNTAPSNSGQDVPGSTLTGVFFDLTGNPALTPFSATIAAGSIVQGTTCSPGPCTASTTDVAGEWGYQAHSFPGSADRGIASSGYLSTGLSHNIGNFNNGHAGVNLDTPDSLDGINFGIISAATGFNPNGGLSGEPLIEDSVTFVLHGVSGLSKLDVSHVSFQYGTALSEANVPGSPGPVVSSVPEPETYAMLLAGLGLMAYVARRRKRVFDGTAA